MSKYKKFKEFLANECYDLEKYKAGKYDRKIFDWVEKKVLKETLNDIDLILGFELQKYKEEKLTKPK